MGPPKSYAFDFKGKINAKNILVVSPAIGIIRSIVALRSGGAVFDLHRKVPSPNDSNKNTRRDSSR